MDNYRGGRKRVLLHENNDLHACLMQLVLCGFAGRRGKLFTLMNLSAVVFFLCHNKKRLFSGAVMSRHDRETYTHKKKLQH